MVKLCFKVNWEACFALDIQTTFIKTKVHGMYKIQKESPIVVFVCELTETSGVVERKLVH